MLEAVSTINTLWKPEMSACMLGVPVNNPNPHCEVSSFILWACSVKTTASTAISASFVYGCVISSTLGLPLSFLRRGVWGYLLGLSTCGASTDSNIPTILAGGAFLSKMSYFPTFITYSVIYSSRISRWALTALILCATNSYLQSRVLTQPLRRVSREDRSALPRSCTSST